MRCLGTDGFGRSDARAELRRHLRSRSQYHHLGCAQGAWPTSNCIDRQTVIAADAETSASIRTRPNPLNVGSRNSTWLRKRSKVRSRSRRFQGRGVIDVLVQDGQSDRGRDAADHARDAKRRRWTCRHPDAGRIESSRSSKATRFPQGSLIAAARGEATPATVALRRQRPHRPATPATAACDGGGTAGAPAAPAAAASAPPAAAPPAAAPTAATRRSATAPRPPPRRGHVAGPACAGPALPPIDELASRARTPVPSVRKFAREIGADLGKVTGTGPKLRITIEDVKAHVKALAHDSRRPRRRPVSALPKVPEVDFAQIWTHRGQTGVAHPADLRRPAAGELDQSAACHTARRCRHHGARSHSTRKGQEPPTAKV
jgi:hypothetical protein